MQLRASMHAYVHRHTGTYTYKLHTLVHTVKYLHAQFIHDFIQDYFLYMHIYTSSTQSVEIDACKCSVALETTNSVLLGHVPIEDRQSIHSQPLVYAVVALL